MSTTSPTTSPAKIGKGKAVHILYTSGGAEGRVACVFNDYDLSRGLPVAVDPSTPITCKRCLKEVA